MLPTPTVKEPTAVIEIQRNSEKLSKILVSKTYNLGLAKEALAEIPKDLRRIQAALDKQELKINDPKNPNAARDRYYRDNKMKKRLNDKKLARDELRKEIESLENEIKALEAEIEEKRALEARRAPATATKAGTKRKSTSPSKPSSPKKVKLDSGAPSKAARPAQSCSTDSKDASPAKRSAPVPEEDESDDDDGPVRPGKHRRTSLEMDKKDVGAPSSHGDTPLSSTVSRSAVQGKRSASSNGEQHTPNKRQKPDAQNIKQKGGAKLAGSSKSRRTRRTSARQLHGLRNHKLACFSSAVIQLLDAAFQGHNTTQLIGPKTQDAEDFGLNARECAKFDNESYDDIGFKPSRLVKQESKARDAIKAAAKAGETEKVSPARHLRNLIGEMNEIYPVEDKSEKYTSPLLFQSVIAYGSSESVDHSSHQGLSTRQQMYGNTQEDAFLYYQTVLDALDADPHTGDSAALKNLFEVQTETTHICRKRNCDYESDAQKDDPGSYHDITVPKKEDGTGCKLSELLEDSTVDRTDRRCPKCSKGRLQKEVEMTKVSDNLVVRLNRICYESGKPEKVHTHVELDRRNLGVLGTKYELSAVICHKGRDTTNGHYTVFRKYQGDWYIINDKLVTKTTEDKVGNEEKYGESTLLLYKKSRTKKKKA